MLKTVSLSALGKPRAETLGSWSLITVHKAGSSYVANMVAGIFAANGYESVDLCNNAFDQGVNVTLGLPFPRTSPDHGTAFDIAGKGVARPDSMIAAINLAVELASKSKPK